MTNPVTTRIEGGRRLHRPARPAPPLVSVVAVVFRAGAELAPLLESIIALAGPDVELIVIDGASDDGTVDLLRRFGDAIDYWLSEPDRGIYDAMNKGVAAATGEFILHINAGDRLLRIPRPQLLQAQADNLDVACFAVNIEDLGIHRPRGGFMLRFANAWHHQGAFYRRSSHLGYSTQFRIFGDFDLNQRMVKAGKSFRLSTVVVAQQVSPGISRDMSTYHEQYQVIKQNFGTRYVFLAHIWRYIWPFIPKIKRWIGWA